MFTHARGAVAALFGAGESFPANVQERFQPVEATGAGRIIAKIVEGCVVGATAIAVGALGSAVASPRIASFLGPTTLASGVSIIAFWVLHRVGSIIVARVDVSRQLAPSFGHHIENTLRRNR